MNANIDWEMVSFCYGDGALKELPGDLVNIIERIHTKIQSANNTLKVVPKEEYGLRSSQVVALVVLLYEMGIIKE